ncbi:MAG: SpoIIE family protein phosphatase [Bryobacterales bacterium]|nr:SpoIIE family protein phosphatase [Bryobacteraceae bacterium]MDW8354614.1 SpoIIE family protein phosphatase [Bryobacterales bacterium]
MAGAAPGAGAARLIVLDPSGGRRHIRIQTLPFRIGRQGDNHLVLHDSRISRQHAQIVLEEGEYAIEDLGSRHGVYVNGVRATRQRLRPSDRIEFGFPDSYQLVFRWEPLELEGERPPAGLPASGLERLRSMLEVARALEASLTPDDVLSALVDAAVSITGAERGFLLLRGDGGLAVRAARSRSGEPLDPSELRIPMSVIERALRERRQLLAMDFDPAGAAGLRPEHSVAELELRSVVCVPLVRVGSGSVQDTAMLSAERDTVGLLYLDSRAGAADLGGGNRELLQSLALEASTILENARLLEKERERQRLEEELRVARRIQESLLPRRLPETGWLRAAGRMVPSHQVGGDYYDVWTVTEDCWAAAVVDVAGKGVSAALLAALLQGIFLGAGPDDAERVLERANRFLLERTGGEKYATVFLCTVSRHGELRWINAGHCPPLLVRQAGAVERLAATSLPAGMLEEAEFRAETTRLSPGDVLVIYSDGLSEARNLEGEFFGERRIREAAVAAAAAGCQAVVDAIERALAAFTAEAPQSDDVTVVVVETATASASR